MSEINAAYEQIKNGDTSASAGAGNGGYGNAGYGGGYTTWNPFGGSARMSPLETAKMYLNAGYYREALNLLSSIIHKVVEGIRKYFVFSYVSLGNCIYCSYINSPPGIFIQLKFIQSATCLHQLHISICLCRMQVSCFFALREHLPKGLLIYLNHQNKAIPKQLQKT